MRELGRRVVLPILLVIISIFLFFDAKNVGNHYYRGAQGVKQAKAVLQEYRRSIVNVDSAILDFKKGNSIVKETGSVVKNFTTGFGNFLKNLANENEKNDNGDLSDLLSSMESMKGEFGKVVKFINALDDPNNSEIASIKLEVDSLSKKGNYIIAQLPIIIQRVEYDNQMEVKKLKNEIKKIKKNKVRYSDDQKKDAENTKKVLKNLINKIDVDIKKLKEVNSKMPSAFWKWVVFFICLVATIICILDSIMVDENYRRRIIRSSKY